MLCEFEVVEIRLALWTVQQRPIWVAINCYHVKVEPSHTKVYCQAIYSGILPSLNAAIQITGSLRSL